MWRRDDRELFYIAADGNVMSVEVNGAGAAFQSDAPKALFQAPQPVDYDVSADDKRFCSQCRAPPRLPAVLPGG